MMNWKIIDIQLKTHIDFFKLTQKFGTDASDQDKNTSTIKNIFLTIQGDYTNYSKHLVIQITVMSYLSMDIGKFNTYRHQYMKMELPLTQLIQFRMKVKYYLDFLIHY